MAYCAICQTVTDAAIPAKQQIKYKGMLVDDTVCFPCFQKHVVPQDQWGRNTKEAERAMMVPTDKFEVTLGGTDDVEQLKNDPLARTSGNYGPPHQKHRVAWICSQVEKGKSILDCGSNMWMAEQMGATDALDIDVYNLKVHKAMYLHRRCWWSSVNYMPFGPKEFDYVVMGDMLEHLGKPGAEDALRKALYVGKKVVATMPNFSDFNQMWWNPDYHTYEVKEEELVDSLSKVLGKTWYTKSPEKHFFYMTVE